MIKDTFLISYLQGKWRIFAFEKIWTITEPDTVNKLCIPCISSMWKYSLSLSLFVCLLVVKFSNIWPLKFKERSLPSPCHQHGWCKENCSWRWIVFVVRSTDERVVALFPAGNIIRDPHHHKSPTCCEQDWKLRRSWVQTYLFIIYLFIFPLFKVDFS